MPVLRVARRAVVAGDVPEVLSVLPVHTPRPVRDIKREKGARVAVEDGRERRRGDGAKHDVHQRVRRSVHVHGLRESKRVRARSQSAVLRRRRCRRERVVRGEKVAPSRAGVVLDAARGGRVREHGEREASAARRAARGARAVRRRERGSDASVRERAGHARGVFTRHDKEVRASSERAAAEERVGGGASGVRRRRRRGRLI
mmetsp:Transcript_3831/g.13226  ORF Transcript_3831/g.13226 Transcript_3831/m.13226 type:complete len:202 (+) Transcript_3831:1170-1775(+)